MKQPIRPVAVALAAFNSAMHELITADARGEPPTPEAVRRVYSATIAALEGYQLAMNFDAKGKPREHLPPIILQFISKEMDILRVGRRSPSAQLIADRGAGGLTTDEYEAIYHAVAYINGVQLGWIKDRSPTKTVCEAYGVNRRTVQVWVKDFVSIEPMENRRASIETDMRLAAARYRVIGRSTAAIRARSVKRRKSAKSTPTP